MRRLLASRKLCSSLRGIFPQSKRNFPSIIGMPSFSAEFEGFTVVHITGRAFSCSSSIHTSRYPSSLATSSFEFLAAAEALANGHIADRAAEIDRTGEYPWDIVDALRNDRLMGLTIPKRFGGAGEPLETAVLVAMTIARRCAVSARIVVESNMGAVGAIMAYGSTAQKQMASQRVIEGDKPAILITEPEAGSAAAEMTTTAERTAGSNHWVLNGRKCWITGGGVSKLHLIFAQLKDNGRDRGIGAFLVDKEHKGLRVGRREDTLGLRGMPEREMLIDNLVLSDEDILLTPEGKNPSEITEELHGARKSTKGFAKLMTAYNAQRVGAAAVATGIAQGAYERALEYSQRREQFHRPICEFQGLQWMLADMSMQLEASKQMIVNAARSSNVGRRMHESEDTRRDDSSMPNRVVDERGGDGMVFPDILLAAQAKVFASEAAQKVTSDALQIFGARGYSKDCPVERMYRDVRMFTIGGGTAQILRTVIASQILGRKFPQGRS